MTKIDDFSKIIHKGNEISKVMFGDVVVWSSPKYEWADDSDFEFVTDTMIGTYLYNGEKGYFKYIGTKEYVAIPDTIKGVQMTSYYRMFFESPASLKGVYSDNSSVTDMSSMFYNSQATSLDLSSFDTSSVTDMSSMFYNSQATSLDLSSFDTSSVTKMGYMFYNSSATTLDLSSFNTSNVTDMSSMFYGSKAASLDLSNFDTSKVTNMYSMFNYSSATSLDLSSFNTSNVTDMRWMFNYSSATSLDLSSFNTSNVTDMRWMFAESSATTLDLSSFDTSKVTNTSYMFYNSRATKGYARTQADADKFNASSNKPSTLTFVVKPVYLAQDSDFVKVDKYWIYRGTELEVEIPTHINGQVVASTSRMFSGYSTYQATAVTKVVLRHSNVTDMARMFNQSKATTLDLSSFDTSNVTDMARMFNQSKATILDLSSFDTSKVTDMNSMFQSSSATILDLSSFDISKVTDMGSMFFLSSATTGYARTQTDANKFNASANKPTGLNFVVKP